MWKCSVVNINIQIIIKLEKIQVPEIFSYDLIKIHMLKHIELDSSEMSQMNLMIYLLVL